MMESMEFECTYEEEEEEEEDNLSIHSQCQCQFEISDPLYFIR